MYSMHIKRRTLNLTLICQVQQRFTSSRCGIKYYPKYLLFCVATRETALRAAEWHGPLSWTQFYYEL